MNFKKSLQISVLVCFLSVTFVSSVAAQQRARVIQTPQITQTNQPAAPTKTVKKTVMSAPVNRPALTNEIRVVQTPAPPASQSLVKKTASTRPTNPVPTYGAAVPAAKSIYSSSVNSKMMNSIKDLYGIPYLYGSTGPNRYDCSGFVWTVFQRAGIYFERSSARTFWNDFEPVSGDDRYKFGTLVFFNKLGHVGIVADENGFYHASSSKGITYSPFKGYWEKRIVGYRRIPASAPISPDVLQDLVKTK